VDVLEDLDLGLLDGDRGGLGGALARLLEDREAAREHGADGEAEAREHERLLLEDPPAVALEGLRAAAGPLALLGHARLSPLTRGVTPVAERLGALVRPRLDLLEPIVRPRLGVLEPIVRP